MQGNRLQRSRVTIVGALLALFLPHPQAAAFQPDTDVSEQGIFAAEASTAIPAASAWSLEDVAIVLEYDSVYDVHSELDPNRPIRSQPGSFDTSTILADLEAMVDPTYYNFVLLFSVDEVPGWINSGARGIRVLAKNIGLNNSRFGEPSFFLNWPNLFSAPHMNALEFVDLRGALTAIHEMAHVWGVFWATDSPGPRGWQPGDPVAWLASASAHWSWNWLGPGMPGLMYSGPTSDRFNAFDLYAMGLMGYAEASTVVHEIYEDPQGTGPPPSPVIHELRLDDLIYSLSVASLPHRYEGDGRRIPDTDPTVQQLLTLIVIVKGIDEVLTPDNVQRVRDLAADFPDDWRTATWGRSSMSVDICDPVGTDSDADGAVDCIDNCRYAYNPGQEDDGGIADELPDGTGNACQCGDVTGDGEVSSADATVIIREALGLSTSAFDVPCNCDVTGDGACNSADATMVVRKALGLSAPSFGNQCGNYTGSCECDPSGNCLP
jgi:hypothetical protein